jgi:hypothetical protein
MRWSIGPGVFSDRPTYSLSISGIVLLSLDVGLHIGGPHQTHIVSQCLKLACPMVRSNPGLDANQARSQLLKERENRRHGPEKPTSRYRDRLS